MFFVKPQFYGGQTPSRIPNSSFSVHVTVLVYGYGDGDGDVDGNGNGNVDVDVYGNRDGNG